MRDRKGNLAVATAVAALTLIPAATRATTYTYDFDNTPITGSSGAGTPLIAAPGTPTTPGAVPNPAAGTVGQDNWVLTSGTSSVIRTDPITGFTGNYAMSPSVTTNPLDGILTRKNDANFGYSLAGASQIVLTMNVLVGPGGAGTTQFRRSEMALGVDLNEDGAIRPTAATNDNPEIGFMFGYETSSGWYVRQASFFSTPNQFLPAVVPSGVWQAQLVVDLAANQATVKDASTGDNVTGGNGSGSLYVRQIADVNGNPVNDVFHAADSSLLNVNLGIMRMASVAGGAQWASDPGNWDGMMIRTAGNGGIDNISISTDPLVGAPAWALNGAGNWTSAANWYPAAVPNGIGATAELGAAISGAHTVYADSDVTVGTLHINNANTYVLAGAGSLTLQTATGNAQVVVDSGTQKINLPLTVASDTTLNVASGATLKISDPVTVLAGKNVTQTGGGTVTYESNVTLQSGATLTANSSSSMHALSLAANSVASLTPHTGSAPKVLQVDTLSLAGSANSWGGTLDVANNALVINQGSLSDLTNRLKAGYNNGTWNGTTGILSSSARTDANHATALAYADGATLLGLTGSATAAWNGVTVDASSLLVKYTWFGDANMDGEVNADDYTLLDRGRAKGLTGWVNGDFNYDGTITSADYLLIDRVFAQQTGTLSPSLLAERESEFGSDYVTTLVASVPEPTSLFAACGLALPLLSRRRRAR